MLRTAKRLGFVLIVFSTALVVGVVTDTNVRAASALAPPNTTPIEIGEVMKKVPAGKVVKSAGRMNPWVNGATLLMGAAFAVDGAFTLFGGEGGPKPETADVPNAEGGYELSMAMGSCLMTGVVVSQPSYTAFPATYNGCRDQRLHMELWCQNSAATEPVLTRTQGWLLGGNGYSDRVAYGYGCGAFSMVMVIFKNNSGQVVGSVRGTDVLPQNHTATTTVKCRKPDGSIGTVSRTVEGHPMEVVMPSCEEAFPGSTPWGITRKSGEKGLPEKVDFDVKVDPTILTDYPECFANGALDCVTTVWINGRPCSKSRSVCHDWWEAINLENVPGNCKFGPYVVALGNCRELREAYRTPGTLTVEGGPTEDPIVKPKAPPNTNPNPNPNPTTGPNPETPPTLPDTETDPDSRSCFADAWSWNPVDWVYVPVKCAFIWAFVPKTQLSTLVTTWKTTATDLYPFNVNPGMGWDGSVGGRSCPNWRIQVGSLDRNVVCDSSFTQAIVNSRAWLAGGMLALAFWPLVRGLFFAAVPIIKPVPTGKD